MKLHLSETQMQAVLHREGPMLVLAGPGSGKTLTITQRIANLIKTGVSPSNILVITFTKAAATQMKERFLRMMPQEGRRVTFGTFHAVFFMVLKYAYHFTADNILREEEKRQMIREIMFSRKLDYEDEHEFAENLMNEISMIKNARISIEHFYPTCCSKDIFVSVYKEYQNTLRRHRKIDFDDMLVYTYELFAQRKDILGAWQNKYQYILVDEFQDVNQIQYDILKMLALPKNNLFMVGDDDQSIYRFRGAKPEIMLHIPKEYPNLQMVNLKENYRCPKTVVDMAAKIISHNQDRYEKEMIAKKIETTSVTIEEFQTQKEETMRVIERLTQSDVSLNQTAVLVRTNIGARAMMEKLLEYNIPFRAKDRVPNLYEHWIAKDIYAYIRIAKGSRQRRDFLMIMNRPKRYLSRESLEEETVRFDRWQAFYSEQPWIEDRIVKLWQDLHAISKMRPFAAVNYIRKAIGYDEFLKEYAENRRIKYEDLLEVIDEIQDSTRAFLTFEEWFSHMEHYKTKMEEVWKKQNQLQDAVTIATFHGAKGLEFDCVHILDVNEEITPHKKAVLPADMEEERRMFYVALTRTKNELHIYYVKQMHNHEVEKSRFLMELTD